MSSKKTPRRELIVAVLGLIVAFTAAWGMRDRVRAVDIIALFAGGLSAGVALGVAISKVRAAKAAPPT